jgi:protocatechuate 3,4-dioxygenase beta subunit
MNRRIGAALAVVVLVALVSVFVCGRPSSRPGATEAKQAPVVAAGPKTKSSGSATPRRAKAAPPLQRLAMRGIVVDREGAPVADAQVVLAIPARTVKSGNDGRFELADLLPGRYNLEARSGGQMAGPIAVTLDAKTKDVVLRMYQGYVLEVEVVAEDTGRPIAGAEVEVSLLSMHPEAGRQRATTGADGIAKLEGLTYIGHDLYISAPGFADEKRGPGPDQTERAPHVRRIRVPMHRASQEIAGRVVDEQGKPIAGATIEAVSYQGGDRSVDEAKLASRTGAVDPHAILRSGLGARSTAQGTFRVGLLQGTWVLLASAPERDVAVSEPLFVERGAPAKRELTLTLGAGRVVRGVVVDSNDVEVAAAHVEARWVEGTRTLATTVSDNGGGFELRGLPAAPIEVIATSDHARSRPVAVNLTAGSVEGAVIALELEGEITGRVVDDAGKGVADCVVSYIEERPTSKPTLYPGITMSDPEGRFRISGVPPRVTFVVSAARPMDGSFGQHAAAQSARAGDNVTITIPAGGAIVGRIVGIPDPRKVIVSDKQTLSSTRPGADGRFRLDRLPALTYQLRVSGAGIADAYVHDVVVGKGRDTDVGDITVRPGRKVAGVVVDTRGKLVDEANVRVEVDGRYAMLTRAAGGKFSLNLPAVPLVLIATHPDSGRSAPIAIGATANAAGLRLAMQAGGTIRGVAKANGIALDDSVVTVWPVGPRPPEAIAAALTDDAGAFVLSAVPPGKYLVELGLRAFEREHRVIQRGVEVRVGDTVELELDASKAPEGTIVQPNSELPELPVHSEESEEHH